MHSTQNSENNILKIKNLNLSFHTYEGEVKVLRGINLDLKKQESVALVGESGSGKTVTAQAIMRLLQEPPAEIKDGNIFLKNEDLLLKNSSEMQKIRGKEISMIFQNPMSHLNPTMKVGKQILESLKLHRSISKKEAKNEVFQLLEMVGINESKKYAEQFPHKFSGGMRQRILIAIALACNPKILIADEPTTALDVTIESRILNLIKDLKSKLAMSVILITHDLAIVSNFAERVIVMYGGEIMEEASNYELFNNPKHPYTIGLLNSIPNIESDNTEPLASIEGTPPDLLSPPSGCPFAPRCDKAMKICLEKKPEYVRINKDHLCKCWNYDKNCVE